MADAEANPTRRSILALLTAAPAAAALSPAAASPSPSRSEWDRRLHRYRCLAALAEAEQKFGAFAEAEAAWGNSRIGRAEIEAAETAIHRDYYVPLWQAALLLMRTPAPDLDAALVKISLIREHELNYDASVADGEAMAIVREDLRRVGHVPA